MLGQKKNLPIDTFGSLCVEHQTLSVVIEVSTCAITKSVWNNPKEAPEEANVYAFANARDARQPNNEVTPKEAKVSAFAHAKAARQAGRRLDEWIFPILQGGAHLAIILRFFLLLYQRN